ncbi:SdrD B-like domain-containing protein [Spirosoma sp.]|uniref:SdrD B-like domain-containing protein n=1 Tax=Spirosoma sp. TaxID=1899569 RepID=UPI003B3B9E8D
MKKSFTKIIHNAQFFAVSFVSATKMCIKPLSFSALLLLLSLLTGPNSAWAQNPGTIGDRVWNDTNENGLQDPGEAGIAGVQVDLEFYIGPPSPTPSQLADPANWSTPSTPMLPTTVKFTDSNGNYSFGGLSPYIFRIRFYLPIGYTFSPVDAPRPSFQDFFDSDAGASGYSHVIYLNDGEVNNTIDAGMFIKEPEGPLPVKLTRFEITKEGDNLAILTWETTEELNSSYFEVQKSADAKSWVDVANVHAKGNHTGLANYQYVDNGPYAGTNYYRLRMVDIDGTFAYSSIKAVAFEKAKKVHIVSYPNPASDQIFIKNSSGFNIIGAQILDLSGRVVLVEKPSTLAAGIEVKSLPEGLYILSISLENGNTERQKVYIKR